MGSLVFSNQILSIPVGGTVLVWRVSDWMVDLDFQNNGASDRAAPLPTISDFMTTTRSSSGNYSKTSAGALTSFAANTPRITDLGLLIEGAATNVVLQSADFSDANWTKTNLTVTTNQSVAPTGAMEMDNLNDGAVATVVHSVNQNPSGLTANAPYSFSVFLKDVDRRYVQLMMQGHSSTGKVWAYFDLQSGTSTDSGRVIGTGTEIGLAYIESFANNTYRCSITGVVNTTDTQIDCYISLADRGTQAGGTTSNDQPSYTGSSKSVLAWGAQMENAVLGGSPVPVQQSGNCSSYIPTAGSTATRQLDDIAMIGSLRDAMSYPEITTIVDYQAPAIDNSGQDWSRAGGFFGDDIQFDYSAMLFGAFSTEWSQDTSDLVYSYPGGRADGPLPHRVAGSRDGSGRSIVADGGTLVSDSDPTTRTSFKSPHFGRGQQGSIGNFYLKRFIIWKSRLPDATLTSYSNQANTSFPGAVFDINFTTGPTITKNVLPADYLSCSRASTGYAKDADGTLLFFENNMLRQAGLGLLIEDARTNFAHNSEDFSGYALNQVTVTTNQTAAPNGRLTMDQIIETNVTDRHSPEQNVGTSLSSPTPGTLTSSYFVKDVDRRYVQLIMATDGTNYAYCYADLQTGTITDSGVAGSSTNASGTIEAFANSTYRVSLTATVPDASSQYCNLSLSDRSTQGGSLAFGQPSYLGTGKSIYAWGFQLEIGAFSSSYVPTAGASVTRAADAVTMIAGLNSSLLGSAASIVTDLRTEDIIFSSGTDYRIIGTDVDPNLVCQIVEATPTIVRTYNSSTALNATLGGSTAYNTGVKIGVAWDGSGRSIVGGGGTVGTDGSAIFGSTPTAFKVGGPSVPIYAYYRRITAWNYRLADATLQNLTVP